MEITKKHYIVKPALAPDSSHILERLGARRTSTDDPAARARRPNTAA